MCSAADCARGTELTTAPEEHPALRLLRARVSAEFREMPGLRLTLPQAARLFGLDVKRCERVLGGLVERGELATDGRVFARVTVGGHCA